MLYDKKASTQRAKIGFLQCLVFAPEFYAQIQDA